MTLNRSLREAQKLADHEGLPVYVANTQYANLDDAPPDSIGFYLITRMNGSTVDVYTVVPR